MSELIQLMKQSISDRSTPLSDNQSDILSDKNVSTESDKKEILSDSLSDSEPDRENDLSDIQSDNISDSLDRTSSDVQTSTKEIEQHTTEIGLTDEELAVKLNVNTNTVKKWRKGQTKPRGKNLQFLKQWEVRGDRWFLKEIPK